MAARLDLQAPNGGRDERQLFICQLRRAVTTVRDAHTVLRSPEAMRKGKAARQGEWFFVEPTAKELDALESALRGLGTIVRRSSSWFRRRSSGRRWSRAPCSRGALDRLTQTVQN